MKKNPKLIRGKKKVCVCVCVRGFPVGSVVNNLPASAEDGVRSLLWEDPVCYRAAKLMYCNYRACALEPSNTTEAHSPGVHAPQQKSPQ